MTVQVRQAVDSDFAWIVDLIDRHRGVDLSAAERSERGFVQGDWTVAGLARFAAGTGIYLAEVDGQRAGVAITSAPGLVAAGPAARTNELAAAVFGSGAFFLYGPVVVDDQFRGRGVLTALFERLRADLRDRFATGVAFIETANATSMLVHRRLGLEPFETFRFDGRDFQALSFTTDPAGTVAGS